MNISVKIEGIKGLGNFARQIPFATAKALTKTVQQGQLEVIRTIESKFTLRTNWYKPSNQIGIRITPAKKNNLVAEVKSNASFLNLHEKGLQKIPFGKYIAIPTQNVRRTKRDLVAKSQYPANLKNSFLINNKKGGKLLLTKSGKGKKQKTKIMYVLVPKAKIKQISIFFEPVEQIVRQNFQTNFNEAFSEAIKTAR